MILDYYRKQYEHREYFKVTIIGYCIVHGGMNEYLVAWGNREKINRAIERLMNNAKKRMEIGRISQSLSKEYLLIQMKNIFLSYEIAC